MSPETEAPTTPPAAGFGRTGHPRRRWITSRPDLAVVAILTLAAGAAALLLDPAELVRVGLGLLLTTCLPGYAAIAAIFAPRRVGGLEGVLLTLGLSLAVVILTGFLLSSAGASLSRETWTAGLVIVTFLGVAVAWKRSPPTSYKTTRIELGSLPRIRMEDGLLLGIAGVLAVAAIGLALRGTLQQPTERFSTVWLIPDEAGSEVRVGVSNDEGRATNYRLVLRDPTRIVAEWPAIAVEDGQQWETSVQITGSPSRLDLDLYLVDEPNAVYRRASWVIVPTPEPSDVEP